jgi:tetratricopeptide (TPR) repeat protein
MLTLGAYVRYVRSPNSPGRYLLVVAAFVLALLSKPSVVTLPFVLLLLDYWPLRRFEQPRRLSGLIREKIPLLALAVGFSVITKMIVVAVEKAPPPVANLFMASRVGNALVSYAVYLRQMVWPQGLAVPYPFPYNGLPAWEVALAGALLAGLSAVAWGERRTRPYLLVGWLWYLGMLVPMLGVIELSYHAHADRYTYLPGIGLALAVTWAIGDSSAGWKHRRAALGILMAAVIGALMVCAWIQTGYWKNSETLWNHTLACTEDNSMACYGLGSAFFQEGRVDDAITQYQKGLEINSNDAQAQNGLGSALLRKGRVEEAAGHFQKSLQINPNYAQAHFNLGAILFEKDRVDDAITQFQKGLRINSNDAQAQSGLGEALLRKGKVEEAAGHLQKALQIDPANAQAHYNLGAILFKKGRVDEAMAHYQHALQIDPDYTQAHYNLANILLQKGRVDEAAAHYQRALQSHPDYTEAHVNLGNILLQKGRIDEAIFHYEHALQIDPDCAPALVNLGGIFLQKGRAAEAISRFQHALQLQPNNPEVQNSLAWLLATSPEASLRNGEKAVQLAQRANELAGGRNPVVLHTLAAAFAEAGRFGDAVRSEQKAIELARAAGRQDVAGQFSAELERYAAGLPFKQ